MSHHGFDPRPGAPEDGPDFQKRQALMRKLLETTAEFRGAVGSYPSGKLNEADEGLIQFAVGEADGKVVIDFGTSVHWLGMTPQQAADFASSVLNKAREVGRKSGETIAFTIGAR